jgi:hypothetical protein
MRDNRLAYFNVAYKNPHTKDVHGKWDVIELL